MRKKPPNPVASQSPDTSVWLSADPVKGRCLRALRTANGAKRGWSEPGLRGKKLYCVFARDRYLPAVLAS